MSQYAVCSSPDCKYTQLYGDCGNQYHTNFVEMQKFCPYCGSPMIGKCPSCGAMIESNTYKFCPDCGKSYK